METFSGPILSMSVKRKIFLLSARYSQDDDLDIDIAN